MKTTDFRNKITSSQLKENMNKMFGVNVDLGKYSREQLEDMRNKLRTRMFQQEGRAGINDLLTNETYQKDKAMLALLNTRIKEMLGEDIKKLRDKMDQLSEAKKGVRAPKHKIHAQGTAAKDYDGDGKVETPKDEVWGSRAKAAKKAGKPFEESAKPDFLDMDKDGNKKEPMKKAVKDKKVKEETGKFDKTDTTWTDKSGKKHPAQRVTRKTDQLAGPSDDDAEKKAKKAKESVAQEGKDEGKPGKNFAKIAKSAGKHYGSKEAGERVAGAVRQKLKKAGKLEESTKEIFKRHVKIVNESLAALLAEDEEGKAKAITAAGDMVNDYTSWMQRVGQYQTKTMIELADAIKADFGAQEAETFKQAVGPALASTLETLTQQREAISAAVAVLAGEATPDMGMGMEPGMDSGMPPAEPGMDAAGPDMMNPVGGADEFGASDAAAGAGTPGREMRESKFARKLAESHSILSKLAR
jgi:hypothetical protein